MKELALLSAFALALNIGVSVLPKEPTLLRPFVIAISFASLIYTALSVLERREK